MKSKVVKMELSELKNILCAVYSKAVNSYHDLQDIIVDDVLNSFLNEFDENSSIEINTKKDFDKTVEYVTLGAPTDNNTELTVYNPSVLTDYNTLALPTSTYYNPLEIVYNQTP